MIVPDCDFLQHAIPLVIRALIGDLAILEGLRLFLCFGAFPIVFAYLMSARSNQQAVEGGIAYEDHCFESLGSVRNTRHCLVEKLGIKLIDHFDQLRFGPLW